MPAPAAMRQTAQFGLETTYGTPVAVTKKFTSFGLGKSRNMGVGMSTPRGQTAPTQGWTNTQDSYFSLECGVLSYDEVAYLLESVCKKVTPTTPTGGTNSRKRVYSIDQFAADAFQSYTVEQGDIGRNRGGKAAGGTVNEWGFTVSSTDDSAGMTGSLIGWKFDNAGMTEGLPATDFTPVIPKHFKLYYATTYAGLTSAPTAIANSFSAGFSIGDRRSLVRYLGKANGEPSDVVEGTPSLNFDLTLADEAATVDTFLTNFRAGSKLFLRLKAKPPTAIFGSVFPELTLDIPTISLDAPGDDESDGVQVVSFPLQAALDAVSGKIFEITNVSAVAAL